jgi:CheY-like chemotaxis protein
MSKVPLKNYSDGISCADYYVLMTNGVKKVLVVEDNADWRELLTIVIRRLGHEVIMAGTGNEGVRQAFAAHPDLILMDLGLPEMSGDEATVQLKADLTTKDIPVVIQTAFGTRLAAKRALQAGAAEVLHKPISIAEIQKTVSRYLATQQTFSGGLELARKRSEPVSGITAEEI